MNRRDFLRYLIAAPIAAHLDVEKLLWIPGEKTIFIPSGKVLSISQIVAIEFERVLPKIRDMFERDDLFYRELFKRGH
jgi:hypothetical protein